MNFAFANSLPLLDVDDQVPADSAVRVLLRDLETARPGDSGGANECLDIAQALHVLGYHRTALTYFAFGIRDKFKDCLVLESDGFAKEMHAILAADKDRRGCEPVEILVAHNPVSMVTFSVSAGPDASREMHAGFPGRDKAFLYREVNTSASSGIINAVDRVFDLPIEALLERGVTNQPKPIRPLMRQPEVGQMEMFVG